MDWDPEVMDERQYIKVLLTSARWNPQLMSEQTWDGNSRTVMQVVKTDFLWYSIFRKDC